MIWQFLKWLKIELSYGPAIPLLDIDPKELKADTCTRIFKAALYTITKSWKHLRVHPQRNGQTKLGHIYNGILFSHEKECTWDILQDRLHVKHKLSLSTLQRIHIIQKNPVWPSQYKVRNQYQKKNWKMYTICKIYKIWFWGMLQYGWTLKTVCLVK